MGRAFWLEPPPPCPVDDTPYTACVAPSESLHRAAHLAASQGRTLPAGTVLAVPVARPSSLPTVTPAASPIVGPSFTTKTYRGRHPKPEKRRQP
jgi:hypothetical protein